MDKTPKFTVFETDFDRGSLEQLTDQVKLLHHHEEIVEAASKITGVDAHVVRRTMRPPIEHEARIPFLGLPQHLPEMVMTLNIEGMIDEVIWGKVVSKDRTAMSVVRRQMATELVEDIAILSMVPSSDYENISVFRCEKGSVLLLVTAFEEDEFGDGVDYHAIAEALATADLPTRR